MHKEEDAKVISEIESKHFKKEVYSWIWNWDKIRVSTDLKQRIDAVDPKRLIESHMQSDDFSLIKQNELALLINAERFFMVMDYKSKWEIELSITEERNKKLVEDKI